MIENSVLLDYVASQDGILVVHIQWAVNPSLFYILGDPSSNLGPDADYPS